MSGVTRPRARLQAVEDQFEGVNLSGAWLDEANLSGAELWAAGLRNTGGLMQAQLDAARGSSSTRLPDELRRPDGWTA